MKYRHEISLHKKQNRVKHSLFETILCLTQKLASTAINQLHEVDVESCQNVMTFIHQTVEGSLKCKDGYIISQNYHFQKGTSYASAHGMIRSILRASFCTKRVTQNNNLSGFEVLFLSLPEVVGCLKRFRRVCQKGILLSFVFSCNALYR